MNNNFFFNENKTKSGMDDFNEKNKNEELKEQNFNGSIPNFSNNNKNENQKISSENTPLKTIKSTIENKINTIKEKNSNVTKEQIESIIQSNIDLLLKEKRLYEGVNNLELVNLIDKKISVYEETKKNILSGQISQQDLNKLFSIFNFDTNNISSKSSSETKKNNYSRFIDQISLYNKKNILDNKKNDELLLLQQEEKDKNLVDKNIKIIQKNLESQILDLKRIAEELKIRGNKEDDERINRILQHSNLYNTLLLKLKNNELTETQKKGLIIFAQNDEERHKFLTERMSTINFSYENLLNSSIKFIKTKDLSEIKEGYFGEQFRKMLNEESIRLFEDFSVIRAKIPGMNDILPNDDIMLVYENIKEKLNEEEKGYVNELIEIQKTLKNFSSIKEKVTNDFIRHVFNEKEMEIEYQLKNNEDFKNSELAKIDMLSITDQEKQIQKENILKGYAEIENKYRKELSRISKEKEYIYDIAKQFDLNDEQIKKHSGNMSIYSLTADKGQMINILKALAYGSMEGYGIGNNLDIDISNIKDYSLLSRRKEYIKSLQELNSKNNQKIFLNNVLEIRDSFLGNIGETKQEKLDRYKKMDQIFQNNIKNGIGGIILLIYQLLENIVNGIENLPKYIAKLKDFFENSKIYIFIMSFLMISFLCFRYEPSGNTTLIELNTKMYSFSNYIHNGNGVMSFAPDTIINYSKFFTITSLIAFFVSIIVMYNILIEIMSKYINFLKNPENKNSIDDIIYSIGKTFLFFLYLGLIFKLFV